MHRIAARPLAEPQAGCHNTLPSYTGHEQLLPTSTSTRDTDPPSMGSVCEYLRPAAGTARLARLRLHAVLPRLGPGDSPARAVRRLPRPALRRRSTPSARRIAANGPTPAPGPARRPSSASRGCPTAPSPTASPSTASTRAAACCSRSTTSCAAPTRSRRSTSFDRTQQPGVRPADVAAGPRRVRPGPRRPAAARPLRPDAVRQQHADRPPAGRGGRALRQRDLGPVLGPRADRLRRLGHAHAATSPSCKKQPAGVRPDVHGPAGRPATTRPARRDAGRGDERDGPHAAHQRQRRPRPLDVLLRHVVRRRRHPRRHGRTARPTPRRPTSRTGRSARPTSARRSTVPRASTRT